MSESQPTIVVHLSLWRDGKQLTPYVPIVVKPSDGTGRTVAQLFPSEVVLVAQLQLAFSALKGIALSDVLLYYMGTTKQASLKQRLADEETPEDIATGHGAGSAPSAIYLRAELPPAPGPAMVAMGGASASSGGGGGAAVTSTGGLSGMAAGGGGAGGGPAMAAMGALSGAAAAGGGGEHEETVFIRATLERIALQNETLLSFHQDADKSEAMSAMTAQRLCLKKGQYRAVEGVVCTESVAASLFDWLETDGKEKDEEKSHPKLQELLNEVLVPAGFYALLNETAKEDTTYPLAGGAEKKVRGQPDAYIFEKKYVPNTSVPVDSGNMSYAVAVVEWKKPSTMAVDKSYSQMCFEVFALGERLKGKPVIGLLTDHRTAAALFSFHARKGTYQEFKSTISPTTTPRRSYLMHVNSALHQLVEWLKADKKPIQEAMPVIPEDDDEDNAEGDADEDGSERGPGDGGAGRSGSGRKKAEPSGGRSGSGDSSSSNPAPVTGFKTRALRPHVFVAGSLYVTPPKTASESVAGTADEDNDACSTVDGENEEEESWPLEAGDGHCCFEAWRDRVPTHLQKFLP